MMNNWKTIAVMLAAFAQAQMTINIGGKDVEIPQSFLDNKPAPDGFDSP